MHALLCQEGLGRVLQAEGLRVMTKPGAFTVQLSHLG